MAQSPTFCHVYCCFCCGESCWLPSSFRIFRCFVLAPPLVSDWLKALTWNTWGEAVIKPVVDSTLLWSSVLIFTFHPRVATEVTLGWRRACISAHMVCHGKMGPTHNIPTLSMFALTTIVDFICLLFRSLWIFFIVMLLVLSQRKHGGRGQVWFVRLHTSPYF